MRGLGRIHVATTVALVTYLVALLVPGVGLPTWVVQDLLGNLVLLLPIVILVRRGASHPDERTWTMPLSLGLSLYLGGSVLSLVRGDASTPTFPSPADVCYLGVYPFLLAALLIALRGQVRRVRLVVALDGLCGTLAGAALAAWSIAPLVDRMSETSSSPLAALAYPVSGVVVIAVSLGALAAVGLSRGWPFVTWAAGTIAFGVGAIVYSYELAQHSYREGTWLNGLWAVGLVLLAVGATNLRRTAVRVIPRGRSLSVVAVSSCCTVVVLAAAPPWHANPVPSVLALLTLLVAAVRLTMAFLQLRELAVVRELALTDELTGAANRRALHHAVDELFRRQSTHDPTAGFGLALIDLDHFKEVNDSFGHAVGDQLLQAVVGRFAEALRGLETPHLLARLGGDEFAVILHQAGTRAAAMACAEALQESLVDPVVLDGVALHAQASIGMAVAPDHAGTRGDLLFAADAAMYAAKTSGEPSCFYSPAEIGDRRKRLEVAEDLYDALERGELTVEYQPIRAVDGSLVGSEALVRWDHPERGRLSPPEFLEIAENYRLTPGITERVLDVALADLHRWRARGSDLRMSVNVSASDLRDDGLVDIVASALLTHDVPPTALTIEITESAMMRDPEAAHAVMAALAALGVELAVDDYGTGYSSLEYLLKLPIDEIKLDRAFSAGLAEEPRAVAIVRSTVDLTHALGLRMVAEGVEDQPTLDILTDLGCDLVQGWHLGRPMTGVAFEGLIEGLRTDRPAGRHLRTTEPSPVGVVVPQPSRPAR